MKTIETKTSIEFNGNFLILNLENNRQLHLGVFPGEINVDRELFLCQINFALEYYFGDTDGFEKHMKINGFNIDFIAYCSC